MKVLIADDSLISRRLLEAALRKGDYEVVTTSNGKRDRGMGGASEAGRSPYRHPGLDDARVERAGGVPPGTEAAQ